MMLTTKNASATLVQAMIIPMRKLQLKVMLPTEAAKAVLKQNISAKKTPAPVTQLANAAVKSVLQSVIAAPLKNLRVVKLVILVPVIMSVAGHGSIAKEQLAQQIPQNAALFAKAIIFPISAPVHLTVTEFIVTVTVPVLALPAAVAAAAPDQVFLQVMIDIPIRLIAHAIKILTILGVIQLILMLNVGIEIRELFWTLTLQQVLMVVAAAKLFAYPIIALMKVDGCFPELALFTSSSNQPHFLGCNDGLCTICYTDCAQQSIDV